MEWEKFFKSFIYAANGILQTIKEERNIKIQLAAAVAAVSLGVLLNISQLEWLVLIIIIGAILSLEVKNSSTERLCNLINEQLKLDSEPTRHPRDMAAGAVLVLSITAVFIGLIIFGPRILPLLS